MAELNLEAVLPRRGCPKVCGLDAPRVCTMIRAAGTRSRINHMELTERPLGPLVFRKPTSRLRVESMVVPIPSPRAPESGSLEAAAEEPAAFRRAYSRCSTGGLYGPVSLWVVTMAVVTTILVSSLLK